MTVNRSKLPFSIVSSSVTTGYNIDLNTNFKQGADITGHHQDTYANLENEPLQSPFTKTYVGGEQHRHIPINTGADNDFNRAEAFKIKPQSGELRVYGPDFENVNKPRAQSWRGAKSPLNIANIQNSGNLAGNFNKNYEVFQTVGRGITNNLIVDNFIASGVLTTQFITGAHNYSLPDIVYNSDSVIAGRFNAPGGKNESSRGALDRAGEELSPNNSLTTRNISVRQPFYDQLTRRSAQFGSGSTEGISIHKVNRNGLKRIELSGSNYINTVDYDNYWVQHAIPRNDFGYAWITASAINDQYTIGTSLLQYDITSSLNRFNLNIDTQTLLGSTSGSGFYSSWKQIRTGEHPVARKQKETNILAIEDEVKPSLSAVINSINKAKRSGTSTNFKEPPVSNKHYPITQEIEFSDDPTGTSSRIKYSYGNISSRFANEDIDTRLGISDKPVEFYKKLVDAKNVKENSPIKSVNSLKFKENIYPRELNTYLSGTRSRTQYILDQAGFDRDGYDRQLGTQRVFWRDNQEDRRRSSNSSGGYINSLGYSSLEESGSNFSQNEIGLLFNNNFILLTSSYIQNITNLNKGINNSIISLETTSSDRKLYTYSGSYLIQGTYEGDLFYKIDSTISRLGLVQDVAGEFNHAFSDFYEQFVKDNQKQSIGAIYRNTDFKKYLTSLSIDRENLLDKTTRIDDEEFQTNPRPRYVSFIGGGELNTGSFFDNTTNFSNDVENVYYKLRNVDYLKIFNNDIIFYGGFLFTYEQKLYNGIFKYNTITKQFDNFSNTSSLGVTVSDIIVSGSDIYAAGTFSNIAGLSTNNIAKYNTITKTWSSLGTGLNSNAESMILSGTDIYVAGNFTSASGISANRIARWSTTGSSWSSLGGGLNGLVTTTILSGTDIYVAGNFTSASGISANKFAVWSTTGSSWSSFGGLGVTAGGTDINSMVILNNDIYVGGSFTGINGVTVNRIARWSTTGSSWSSLGTGLTLACDSLFVSGTDIYAGGSFLTAGGVPVENIARWSTTGSNWSSVGTGYVGSIFNSIFSIAVYKNKIIMIGNPSTIAANPPGIVIYDPQKDYWEPLNFNGDFNNFNYNFFNQTSSIENIKFSTLDNGLNNNKKINNFYDNYKNYLNNDVYQIAKNYSIISEFKISDNLQYYINKSSNFKSKNNSFLILDGAASLYKSASEEDSNIDKDFFEKYSFTDIVNKNKIETDYSSELSQDNISINISGIKKLLPYNGFFPQDRLIQISNLYNNYVNNVLSGGVYSLENINVFNNKLSVSGSFVTTSSEKVFSGTVSSLSIESFNETSFLLKNNYFAGDTLFKTAQVSGTDIYIGGSFQPNYNTIGQASLIKWDTINNSVSSLGNDYYGFVDCMIISGADIYIGGSFNVSVYSTINKTVTLLSSINTVSLAISGTDLYVGGDFTAVGALPANNIAKYDTITQTWSALGTGVNNRVRTISVSGSDIYVGGDFTTAGGSGASRVARWSTTGSSWSALGSGVNNNPNVSIVSGTDIYFGGFFTTAGGSSANRIARWSTTGSSWSSLGSGITGTSVKTINISGSDIYVGGNFTTAGGSSALRVARWNISSSTWFNIGAGYNNLGFSTGDVNSLLSFKNSIYAFGTFGDIFQFDISALNCNISNSYFMPFDISSNISIYTSSNNSYEFSNKSIKNLNGFYKNSKLISSSNGLSIFSFKEDIDNLGKRNFTVLNTNNITDWTPENIIMTSSGHQDLFGEYWDYIYIPEKNKYIFAISSPREEIGGKFSAGAVRIITSSISFDLSGNINLSSSYLNLVGTGSNSYNNFGTGLSLISCSSGYQLFIGEQFGDTTTDRGNIWVVTSSNGEIWSNPISIVSGSVISSSIGYNNIKATNFTNNNISRTYVFFTEPYSKPDIDNEFLNGKLFVISSSVNNNWGDINIDSQKTILYNIGISSFISGTLFDVSGTNNKNSIEVFSDSNKITYCFVNSIDDSDEDFAEIRIGNCYDGVNWQKQNEMFILQEGNASNYIGFDVVAKTTYNLDNSQLKFPVFFTNISHSSGIDAIYSLENNKFTQFKLNISGTEKLVKQAALEPVMSPGILYNTIKSGISVDWPCATGSQTSIQPYGSGTIVNAYYPQSFKMASHQGTNIEEMNIYGNLRSNIDYRVDFEKLIFPDDIFPVKQTLTSSLIERTNLLTLSQNSKLVEFISGAYIYGGYEPYLSSVDVSDFNQLGPKRFSIPFVYRKENAKSDGLYSLAMSNFLAETIKFFLKDGLLTSFQSAPDSQWETFESTKKYYMDIIISKTPELVMMEAYHSEKHPIGSSGEKMDGRYFGYPVNKTNKKLWSQQSDDLFTSDEARLIHNDPAYAPYTPPYFEGTAIARVSFTPSITRKYSLDEVLSGLIVEDIFSGVARSADLNSDAYINKMPVEASLNIRGKLPWVNSTNESNGNSSKTTNNDINTWIISTKFETPVLDFSSQSLTPYENNYLKSSGYGRGMWSGYGSIPIDNKGIYVSLQESFPQKLNKKSSSIQSLLQKVGFQQTNKKIGMIADKKQISEAIMIIPFIEIADQERVRNRKYSYGNKSKLTQIEKDLGIQFIGINKKIYNEVVSKNITGSILDTYNNMSKFIVPPQLDYKKDLTLDPYVAYIAEFTHELSQQDLANIWQGVAPEIATKAELQDVIISHSNDKNEFYHGEGLPNEDLRFMIFKIKQKGEFNYFKVTKDSTDDLNFSFEQKIGRSIDDYSYNWPYDYFSLVELAKVDIEIDYKKKDEK